MALRTVGEDVEEGSPSTLLGEMQISAVTMENSLEILEKIKHRTNI